MVSICLLCAHQGQGDERVFGHRKQGIQPNFMLCFWSFCTDTLSWGDTFTFSNDTPQEGVGQECGEGGLLIPGMRRMREHWCGRHIHSPINLPTPSSPHQPPTSLFLAWVPLAFNHLLQICQCFAHWLDIKLSPLPIHPQTVSSSQADGEWLHCGLVTDGEVVWSGIRL